MRSKQAGPTAGQVERLYRSVVRRQHLHGAGCGGARINTVLLTLACGHMRRYAALSEPTIHTLRCPVCEADALRPAPRTRKARNP